jgi:biopolymer transport protein ExbD
MRADGFYPSKKMAQRQNRFLVDLNLWPFVGVLVFLLVLMIVQSLPKPTSGVSATLALVRHAVRLPLAAREDAMRITITRDDSVYFRGSKMMVEELPGEIRECIRNGSEKRVYMVVDARAKYGTVKQVLDEVRNAKVENVSFLVGVSR